MAVGGRIITPVVALSQDKQDRVVTVFLDGAVFTFGIPDPLSGNRESGRGDGRVEAPLPGLVQRITVTKGDSICRGDELIVLEAMKMQHALAATCDGIVGELMVGAGDSVAEGDLLLTLDLEVAAEAAQTQEGKARTGDD